MKTQKPFSTTPTSDGAEQDKKDPYAPLPLDHQRYAQYLDDLDVTEDEARQFMEAMWRIVGSFVDMGFGLDPAQIVVDAFTKAIEDECKAQTLELKALMDEAANDGDTGKIERSETEDD